MRSDYVVYHTVQLQTPPVHQHHAWKYKHETEFLCFVVASRRHEAKVPRVVFTFRSSLKRMLTLQSRL